jgi:transposase
MKRSEARSIRRKEVIEAIVIRSEPVHLVARIYNIAPRTVFAWLARYRNGGWDALKEGARPGRPRKMTSEAMEWVDEAVTMGSPLNPH